jgi:4-carboxymuconolactone decarboxylase
VTAVATLEELRAIGQKLRQRVFGAPAPGAPKSPTQELAPDLGRISDEVLFGQVWSRPGLELPHRSMITIAALTAMGREVELRAHIRGGLNLGLTREQIVEIIMQMAFYAGQPAAHAGFRAAKEVFDSIDKQAGSGGAR